MTPSHQQDQALQAIAKWLADPNAKQSFYLGGFAGSGKCLGKGTPILMFDGSIKSVESVIVGDLLMGPDSKPRKVLSLGRGTAPLYRVNPIKGESWVCNEDHLLTLVGSKMSFYIGKTIDISVKDLLKRWPDRPDAIWKLWRTGVEFKTADQIIEPYLMGLWLGDGTQANTNITSMDSEIIDYCEQIAPKYSLTFHVSDTPSRAKTIHLGGVKFRAGSNILRTQTRLCIDSANEKFIPRNYLIADRTQRLQLLAGLIDTDGSVSIAGIDYITKSQPLCRDILFLARSLGFAAYVKPCRKGIKSTGFTGNYFRISILGDIAQIPCKLPRKQAAARRQIKRVGVTGFGLEPLGIGEYFGFTIDGDGRFLLGDFTVTHNTTLAKHFAAGINSVCFAAFTGKASLVMRRKGCTGASTIHSLIYIAEHERGVFKFSLNPESAVKGADLVIIDECSMVGADLGHDLLSFGTKVLVLGDPAQLPPVDGAGYFTCRKPDFMLTEIHRQAAESPIIRMSMDVREGRKLRLGGSGAVRVVSQAQFDWQTALDASQALCGLNRTRRQYNQRMRKLRGFPETVEVGDKLICLKNARERGLMNGGLWRVHQIRYREPSVRMVLDPIDADMPARTGEDGGDSTLVEVKVNPLFFEGREDELSYRDLERTDQFYFGECITTHKSQGSQWPSVVVFDESKSFREDASKWLYTAVTRAESALTVVVEGGSRGGVPFMGWKPV